MIIQTKIDTVSWQLLIIVKTSLQNKYNLFMLSTYEILLLVVLSHWIEQKNGLVSKRRSSPFSSKLLSSVLRRRFWKFGPKTNVSLWPISRNKVQLTGWESLFKSLVNIKKVSDKEILIPFHLCDKCKHCITIDSILYFNLYKSPHYEWIFQY